ncbi:unnamed protein product, partial [Nippostrongylus brasiliensis]|uniref:Col_cuticle_N domain-containing protein n=1 Tax=Nippostrongylus brasiliensis TaxID=27835 RepID=A0A0N4XMR7_NIPBR
MCRQMREERLVVTVASATSLFAVAVCVAVLPALYSEIDNVHNEILDAVAVFRVETDSAWLDMMDVQIAVSPPSRPRQNPFNSVFRIKRQRYGGLPNYCQCELLKPICRPGPPGP